MILKASFIFTSVKSPTLWTHLLAETKASPGCCWTLLFQGLDVDKLHSLSSTSGLKNIALWNNYVKNNQTNILIAKEGAQKPTKVPITSITGQVN